MLKSYSQSGQAPCPSCGQDVPFEAWLIVDVAERPDLLTRAREGNLNPVKCPHCGHETQVVAPLLIHDSGRQRLFLGIPPGLMDEQAREVNAELVERLLSTLGDGPRPDYLGQTQVVPLAFLPAVLVDDPEAAQHKLQEIVQQASEELVRRNPAAAQWLEQLRQAGPLLDMILDFIQADTWEQSRRILEQHPELLSDQADALLEILAQGDPQERQVVEEHRALLRRCRLAEYIRAQHAVSYTDIPYEFRPLLEAITALPIEQREALAEIFAGADNGKALETSFNARPDLRAALEQAVADIMIVGDEGWPVPAPFRGDWRQAQESLARYQQSSDRHALDEAVAACERIFRNPDFATAEPNVRLAAINDGGVVYLHHYLATGRLEDLDQAIKCFKQAVGQTPPASSNLPGYLNNLGGGLRARYALMGELVDLEGAIKACQQAVDQTPPGSSNLPSYLNNLGSGLRERYALMGKLVDLEGAIKAYQSAMAMTPPDSPDLPMCLNNLGTGLEDRYGCTRVLADLEGAINAYQQAVARTPPGSPDLSRYFNNLGNGLCHRYERTGALADLEGAINAYQQAVGQAQPGSPELSVYLNNLGTGLRDRYARTGELADLERTINAFQQAVTQTPSNSPELPCHLHNLGLGLMDRYAWTGALADLEQAIQVYQQAVAQTPFGSPDLPRILDNVGAGLSNRYVRTGELADLEAAIATWERAWDILQTTFVAASVAYKLGQQRQGAGLYTTLVAAQLQRAKVSPSQATAAHRRALEVAEGSKSRLLTELVGRGDLPAPPAIPPQQATRERDLLDELTALDTAELAAHGRPATSQEEAGRLERLQRREECLQELRRLWEVMTQASPEAADYVALRRGDPPTWNDLARLAADLGADTALISLFIAADRTFIFVLRAGWEEPVVVEDELDWNDIWRRFSREVHGYDGTDRRGETWDRLLRSLLEKTAVHLDEVERIIFAPEALGHLLPWGVLLGRALRQGSASPQPAVVTVPALGLLPRLRRRPAGKGGGALVAGNPRGDLKYAEEEAREVAKMLGTASLIGCQATKAAVLAQLSEASVVHLATHAYFAAGSPLDSGILLADGILTAREVMSHRLQADLLVLSACQTGMAEALGGDELAGLAQAFLQAGARSLLVSLWAVNDPATAALMTAFYTARQAGAEKAQALSQAMAQVRAQAKWSHTYYWGAFVLMGN